MLLYYITDRAQFPGNEHDRRQRLLEKIAEAARCGVDYIQLREKDLSTRELETLASQALKIIRESGFLRTGDNQLTTEVQVPSQANPASKTRLLINSRTDIALAAGADGVQLRSDDISPTNVRKVWRSGGAGTPAREPVIAISCHSPADVAAAATEGADFAVFAPVFEKNLVPATLPMGLEALRQACRHNIRVFALGGVTVTNAQACMDAGAAGVAAIRLFQQNEIAEVMRGRRG